MSNERVHSGIPEPQGRGQDPFAHYTRIFLVFLQGLFKQFEEGSYHWSDDENLTEIAITDQSPFPAARIAARPAIVTMRGPFQFSNLSLDQLQTVDSKTGKRRHTDLGAITMTLNCLSKEGREAQRLGWIVARHIRLFKRLLQRAGIHKVGDEVSVGPETPPGSILTPEADSECVMVTVQAPFFFQWTEEIEPLNAPLFKGLEMHMQTASPISEEFLREARTSPLLRKPTIRGQLVDGISVPLDSKPVTQTVKP